MQEELIPELSPIITPPLRAYIDRSLTTSNQWIKIATALNGEVVADLACSSFLDKDVETLEDSTICTNIGTRDTQLYPIKEYVKGSDYITR